MVFFFLSAALSFAGNPRDLPSLVELWRSDLVVSKVGYYRGLVYAVSSADVTALDPETGAVLWTYEYSAGDGVVNGPTFFDDTLAFACGETLTLLDSHAGIPIATVRKKGAIHELVGPPLLASVTAKGSLTLERIDEKSGLATAEWDKLAIYHDIATIAHMVVVLNVSQGRMFGLREDDLSLQWERSVRASGLHVMSGKLYLDNCSRFTEVNAQTGELGEALPERRPSPITEYVSRHIFSFGLSWELPVVPSETATVLRRYLESTGRMAWEVELPGLPTGWVREGQDLYLHCNPDAGRGQLLHLDVGTGEVKHQAYGLRALDGLLKHESVLIAVYHYSHTGLIAFSAASFGPSASDSAATIQSEVRNLLLQFQGGTSADISADLRQLGTAALPFVVEVLRELRESDQDPSLVSMAYTEAVKLLDEYDWRQSIPVLTSYLTSPPSWWPASATSLDNCPVAATIRAIGNLGGHAEIPILERVLADPSYSAELKRASLATLGALATEETLPIIDRFFQQTPKRIRWFEPASPVEFIDIVGIALDENLIGEVPYEECLRQEMASKSTKIQQEGGSTLVVFPDSRLGGDYDLWASRINEDGELEPAVFLGVAKAPTCDDSGECGGDSIVATMKGENIEVWWTGEPDACLNVALSDAGRDSDKDGLPDLVEKRFLLDLNSSDTDGDGISDAEDLAPNARDHHPRSQDALIKLALFRHYMSVFPQEPHTLRPIVVVDDLALEWRGWAGPTISLSNEQHEKLRSSIGYNSLSYITMARADEEKHSLSPRKLKPGEIVYMLTRVSDSLCAVGYSLAVRKVGDCWVVTDMQMEWLS